MPGRLFWKILLGFWATFFLIIQGMWLLLAFYGQRPEPQEHGGHRLAEAAALLSREGPQALSADPGNRRGGHLEVVPVEPDAAAAPPVETGRNGRESVVVEAPDHRFYRLTALPPPGGLPPHGPGFLHLPTEILVLGIFGGLAFSAVLAWYLTRPIETLQKGFRRLAEGDLSHRLAPAIGTRRDEIADLAREFDEMAVRLQQLVELRDQLLHDVSHELRSPLARLHVAVGLLRQNPQRLQQALERIEAETLRLDGMVGELLTLSRVESGSGLQDSFFDVEGLMLSLLNDARFEAQAQGVAIEAALIGSPKEGEAPTVRGNAELVRRAIENIVRNALRFSPQGGRIFVVIDTRWAEKCYRVSVIDQGPGVPPDQLKAIFEPFVRCGRQQGGGGFGLGLSIARRTILAHGGRIRAENNPSGGLAVMIDLPFGPQQVF